MDEDRSGQGLAAVQGTYSTTNGDSEPATGEVRGNRNSQIYHLPECPSFDRIADHNRKPFGSEADARDAGYRKAGNCP